jgi:hypothetical protein
MRAPCGVLQVEPPQRPARTFLSILSMTAAALGYWTSLPPAVKAEPVRAFIAAHGV